MNEKSKFVVAPFILLIVIMGLFLPNDQDTPEAQPLVPTETEVQEVADVSRFLVDWSPLQNFAVIAISKIPAKPNLNPEGKIFFEKFKPMLDEVTLPTCTMVMESLGNYWVTNYCPAECGGSWATSSGATCHRSSYEDRLTTPTTCAIDLSVGDYGDLYYIPAFDRVFIAEDTGSGVKGKWLDLFYEDYSDVVNFPVGYYEVYSVEYVYGEVPACNYDVRSYMKTPFEEALAEYNYEPWAYINIITIQTTPWNKSIIVNIDVGEVEEKPMVVPYI